MIIIFLNMRIPLCYFPVLWCLLTRSKLQRNESFNAHRPHFLTRIDFDSGTCNNFGSMHHKRDSNWKYISINELKRFFSCEQKFPLYLIVTSDIYCFVSMRNLCKSMQDMYICSGYLQKEVTIISIVLPFVTMGSLTSLSI